MTAVAVALLVTLAVATCVAAGSHAVASSGEMPHLGVSDIPSPVSEGARRIRRMTDRFRARRRFDRALPRFVEAVARELRGGAPMRAAVLDGAHAAGGPFRSDADRLSRRLDAGQSVSEVLGWWATDRNAPELARLALVADTGTRVGGELARALDGVAAAMTDRREVAAEARSLSSQARASAVLLVVAPVAFGALMAGLEPRAITFLLGTPLGWATVTVAVLLDVAGAAWMYRLTERVR